TEAVGVSSRTLYKHIGSKSALIVAVLDARSERFLRAFAVETVDEFFTALASWSRDEGARGCLFLRARGENGDTDPERSATVAKYREQLLRLIGDLVRHDTGKDDPFLAEQLLILFEGATSAVSYRGTRAIDAARSTAATLVALRARTTRDNEL